MSYYKKGYCSSQDDRYIHIAEDDSDIYQDKETMEILSDYVILERLNEQDKTIKELSEENEQLKQAYQTLKSRHSLLHDECLEAECDRDSLKKDVISLEKENENLNNVLEDFMVMLNRLQAEPNNKSLQGMARDMLQMMGKNIMGDSDD